LISRVQSLGIGQGQEGYVFISNHGASSGDFMGRVQLSIIGIGFDLIWLG